MDTKLGNYFCIFCAFKCENIDTAYKHYTRHMRLSYYCVHCDNASGVMNDTIDYAKQCKVRHQSGGVTQREQTMINMWIERFLAYQSTILDKSYREMVSSKEHPMFVGCPVCQCLLMACHSRVQSDVMLSDIKWSNQPTNPNMWRHSCSHLHYYQYMCLVCEKVGRYHKKCDFSEMARHFKTYHATDLSRDSPFDGLINHVQISKIESFIEICSNVDKNKLSASSGRKSARKKSSDTVITDSSDTIISGDSKRGKQDTTIASITDAVYDEVIRRASNGFTEHYNEDHNNANNNNNSGNYFCVFCEQTFGDKETVSRHYKRHIDYYPIACLTCNERLTDLQSFVTHHSEAHASHAKGRFKKKERPELDTWIKSFLLFQATITGTAQQQQSLAPQPSHLTCASCVDCPVCLKLIEVKSGVDVNELVVNPRHPNYLSLSVHLHQHLVYYPYECALCMAKGKSVRVASRDSVAVSHLIEHQFDISTAQLDKHLTENFPKTLCIPEIEELIECYARRRSSKRREKNQMKRDERKDTIF